MVRDDRQTCLFVLNIFLFNFHHTENKKKLIDCCRVELKLIQFLRNVTFAQYFDAKHCRLIGTNVFTKKKTEKNINFEKFDKINSNVFYSFHW